MAEHLFDWFGFDQTSNADANSKNSKTIQKYAKTINRRLAIQ